MKKIYNRDIVTRDYISNRKRKDRWLGLLTMCLLFVIGTSGFAQVSAYTFIHSEETYESIVEDGVLVPDSEATNAIANDGAGWVVTIPFGFNFNSINYTSIYVNSNGGATFGATNSTSSSLISSSAACSGAISVMNRDLWGLFVTSGVTTSGSNIINNVGSFRGIAVGKVLNAVNGIPSNTTITAFDVNAQTITMSNNATTSAASAVIRYGTGKIFTKVEGNAPNRIFTIQWEGYNDYGTATSTSNYLSFQLKLAETSNTIKIVYGDYYNLSTTSRTNQIGLRGATNSDYYNRTGTVTNPWTSTANGTSNSATVARNDVNFPASGLTFTWTAPVAEAVPNCIALPTAPANNAVNIVSNTFTWPAATGLPNGYRFYLGTDEEATDLINGEDIGAVLTYNAASITLSPGTQYYWRAVAYNDFGDAESCTIWSFTTAPVPNCATGHSPADLATAVARNPTLTWTAPTSPSASSYDIYIGTSPNPAFVTNVTSASYISPLLAANTTYYWKVIPKNASGSATGCIERSFTTGPDIVYCTPASTGNGTYIDNFSTTLGTTNISNLTSGYTTGGYQNNFSSTAVTSFVGGSFNYNFTIVGGTLGAAIWIDWNSNGTFETGEKVFVTSGYGSGPYAGTITIPGGTALGDYRMRVMVDYNNSAPSNPCMTANARTETEDYKITVGAAPSCLAPTALASSNIATTTATLSWTASTSSPSNGYDVYYSTTNTAPLEGTVPTVNDHTASPLNATGLTSASTYYWWVRSDCGAETSAWASGGSFTTLCDLVTTFSQNWDGVAANALPICFNKVGTLGTVNTQAGSASSGTNTLYIYGGSTSSEPTFALQPVSNAGAGTHWLKFKLRANFTVGGKLQVGYLTNPTDATSFVMIQEFIANSATTYEEFKCIPGTLPGSNTTLALRAKGSPANSMLVDDLVWELMPSCLSPTALVASAVTANTATLSWTASTSSPTNGYDIYYSTTNTAPLAGTTPSVNNHSASPLNLTGLTSASTYYWWVRSDCDSETSAWAYGGSFTTLCVAFTIPYSENFDTTATGSSADPSAPTCWSYLETAAGAGSGYTYSFGTPNTTPNHFYLTNSSDNSGSYMLVSPNTTDLSDGSNRVRFYAKAGSAGYVLALGTLSDPLDVNSFTSIQAITLTATYAEYTVNLPAGTDSYLAFKHGLGGTYRSVYIDNVMVENMPSCLEPTSLMSSNVTTSSADLSWTSAGSDFDIKYGATGFNVATEGTLVENFTNGGTLSSLTTGTNYQYYVRQDCGNGDLSAWAGPYSFRIPNIGESCSAPIAVTALPYTTTDDTANYSDNPAYEGSPGASGCGSTSSYLNGNDVVYAYTSTFTGAIKIDLTPTATYSGIFAYASCADIGVNCIGGVANDGTTLRTFNLNVQNGSTYYLVISTWATPQTTAYTLNISKVCPAGVWVGTTSNFNTASNWADNMVPEACTAVTVNVAAPMTISSDVTVASITLGATAVVTVGSTGVLNVGTISVATGGNLTINSDGVVLQSSTAANTAVATVKRNSTPLFRQDYTLWSSPVTGQNLRAFSTQTLFNRFSSYNTATNAYTQEIVTVADMDAKTFTSAKGYLIRMPNDWVELPSSNPAQSYSGSFTGTLNNGTITIPLLNETVDPGTPRKLNLVGNPYPSPISIAAFFAANTNIDQTLYFLRKKGTANLANTASSYAVLNGLGFTSADTDINGVPPTNIQTGQGFLVVANAGTPGNPTTLTFNNTMRTNGTPTFYKGATETNELHRLWLNLSNNSSVIGQTLIGYATGATQGVDSNFDALYFNDSDTALTSIINNSEYIIQGRALPFLTSDIVPLGFKTSAAGSFTITLSNFDGLFTGSQDVFLKDNSNNTVHNLKTAAYTFTSPVGVFNQRFEVQYEGALGTNNPSSTANDILIGVKNQQIKINAGSVTMKKIELIDVSGRIIYTTDDVNATTATIENMVISNQMLVVRITTTDNAVVNQKIIF